MKNTEHNNDDGKIEGLYDAVIAHRDAHPEPPTEYEKWVEWRVQNGAQPMTRTQSLLAQEILSNETLVHMLAQPGDLHAVFYSIQKYLKNK